MALGPRPRGLSPQSPAAPGWRGWCPSSALAGRGPAHLVRRLPGAKSPRAALAGALIPPPAPRPSSRQGRLPAYLEAPQVAGGGPAACGGGTQSPRQSRDSSSPASCGRTPTGLCYVLSPLHSALRLPSARAPEGGVIAPMLRGGNCGPRGWRTCQQKPGPQDPSSAPTPAPAQSMFQIPEFEHSEQEDSSPADRGLGPSPTGDQPPGLNKHWSTVPGLLGEAGHQQGQPASSSHHDGAGSVEPRSRHSSYPTGTEEDDDTEEGEPSPFRGRSRSAPPNLWAAQRYGRELRRMSDEFQGSFKGLPRPKSAGTATQMRQKSSWTRFFQSWWDRNSGRGGSAPSQ